MLRSRVRLPLVALMLALVSLLSPAASAQSANEKVLAFDARAPSAFSERLEAEILSEGFLLTAVTSGHQPPAAVAQASSASGVVRIVSSQQVELWVLRDDGSVRHWYVERGDRDDASFALATAEQLRGAMVEFDLAVDKDGSSAQVETDTTAPGDNVAPAAPPPTTASTSPPPRQHVEAPTDAVGTTADTESSTVTRGAQSGAPLWALAGLGATLAVGGAGLTPQADLGLRLEFPHWALTGRALVPLMENEVIGFEGEGEVNVNLFLLEQSTLVRGVSWSLEAGPGAGLLVLPLSGEAQPGFEVHPTQTIAGLFEVHVGASWVVLPWFRVHAGLRAGLAAPRPVVRFAGREVMAWGRLFTSLGVGGQFALPWFGEVQ